jgi:hypothetical protein
MNQTNTQDAEKRAEPDVACSARLGRGGMRVDSLLLGFLADWVSGFGLRIEEWSDGELPYRIYEGHQGAPDTLYIAEGENLRDALLDAAILSGTQEFVSELQAALHPPTEQAECGWRAIARTNEAAYNETLAALRDLRTAHTDMMRMWMEESQAVNRELIELRTAAARKDAALRMVLEIGDQCPRAFLGQVQAHARAAIEKAIGDGAA